MKKLFKTALLVSALGVFMFGCAGEDGALGPVGPSGSNGTNGTAGTNGTNGVNGTNGKDGNANVVYTDWKTIDWTGGFFQYNGNKNVQLAIKSTDEPLFTQEAMDKAVVYTYYKINDLVQDLANGSDYKIADRVGTAGYYFFKRPGITTSKFDDYSSMYVSTNKMGLNFFQPVLTFLTQTYDYTVNNYVVDPQFSGKVAADYREYAKPLTYRHVIVYGSTKAGRVAPPVNMADYKAVKAYYKIRD